MLAEERRGEILQLLREQGRVRVGELSRRFNTSEVTIRSDLRELQERGQARKAHGGALLPDDAGREMPLREKARKSAAEKQRIGAAAAALVKDGETIILDSGTTTQEIAKRIKDRQNLRVITNGVNIAMELVGARGVQVVLLGGMLRDNSYSIVGNFAEKMLGEFSADKVFLGADGCDTEFGVSTPNLDEAHVNQAMARAAREKILVADARKFGRKSLSRIVALSEFDQIISDKSLSEEQQQALSQLGPQLLLV
jgi:DeoR family transcriptional regulator of aga operon